MDAVFQYILKYRLVLFVAWLFSGNTLAVFQCWTSSGGAAQQSKTLVVSVDPVEIERTSTTALITDMSAYAQCDGWPSSGDALRTTSFSIVSDLTSLGFNGYIQFNGGTKYTNTATSICIWPDSSCSTYGNSTTRPIYLKLGLQRSDSSDLVGGTTISSGTEIARLVTQMRYGAGGISWKSSYVTWSFVLNSDMIVPVRTCTIQNYETNVTLPSVARSDLMNQGAGRYPNAKKEFKFILKCDAQTSVSVTFEGDPLTGTDNVLKNALTGNDNIGVQMTFSDDTPVKLATKYPVVSSAQASEILNLNAYYYYKGGTVSSGPVKANTTFTFDYQ